MAKINWTNVNSGRLPTYNPSIGLQQSANSFRDLTRNALLLKKLQAPAEERKRLAADKKAQIAKERKNSEMFKKLMNTNHRRVSSPEVQSLLMKDEGFAKLSREKQADTVGKYLNVLNAEGSSIRDFEKVGREYKAALEAEGSMTRDEISSSVDAMVKGNYNFSDKAQRERMQETLKLQLAQNKSINADSRRGSGGGYKGKGTSNAEMDNIADSISGTYGLSDSPDTIAGFRFDILNTDASKSDLKNAIAFFRDNAMNSSVAAKDTLLKALNPNGTIKPEFDWTTKPGQKALLAAARSHPAYNVGEPQGNYIDIGKRMATIARSGQPQVMPAQEIADAILQNLPSPQEQAVQEGYTKAGGQGAVSTPNLFDPNSIPVNRDMTGNALEQLGLVTPERAVQLEQDATGYQPDESGYVPIDFSQPQVSLNLGGGETPAQAEVDAARMQQIMDNAAAATQPQEVPVFNDIAGYFNGNR